MITFVSMFLGLITGVKPVELAVSGPVTEIEIRLDGESLGLLREAPWRLKVDFGRELTTHELVAIARDLHGTEIDRASQWINIPRPHVDAQILLDGWRDGSPRSARLTWQSVELIEPAMVKLTLDGKVLADRHLERYKLPSLDPDAIHLLSAHVEFPQADGTLPDHLSASAEVVFGGVYGDSTETELTAISLIIDDRKPRRVEQLQGRLEKAGKALRVVAVEDGPAEVVIVRDHKALLPLTFLGHEYHFRCGKYQYLTLAKDDALHIMSPRSYLACHPDTGYVLFPVSPPITHRNISLPWTLATLKFENRPIMPQRLTDAVATAGLRAAASRKRRAVVLAVADCAGVSGQWSPKGVRHFLSQLQVPFSVWQVEPPATRAPASAGGFCDGAQPIHNVARYQAAIKRLRRELQAQQIVWVEGRHLQREITLIGSQPGMRLAGERYQHTPHATRPNSGPTPRASRAPATHGMASSR